MAEMTEVEALHIALQRLRDKEGKRACLTFVRNVTNKVATSSDKDTAKNLKTTRDATIGSRLEIMAAVGWLMLEEGETR